MKRLVLGLILSMPLGASTADQPARIKAIVIYATPEEAREMCRQRMKGSPRLPEPRCSTYNRETRQCEVIIGDDPMGARHDALGKEIEKCAAMARGAVPAELPSRKLGAH